MERPTDDERKTTTDQLRDEIDRGGAADKVAFRDPAAAPLGTDAEAAGTPPTPEQIETARRAETHRAAPAEDKPAPPDLLRGHPARRVGLLILAVVVLVGLVAWLA